MTDEMFAAWLAMEDTVLAELVRQVPELEGRGWEPGVLSVIEKVAMLELPPLVFDGTEAAVLWRRLLRGVGAVYTRGLGAVWVCASLMVPGVGVRRTPVLDVPGMPVWLEVGQLLDHARSDPAGGVLEAAYTLAGRHRNTPLAG